MAYGKILADQVENSDGKSLNVGPGARVFDTVAELQASTTLSDGDIVIVKERANAEYEIQSSAYTALEGDLSMTSGQVAELQLKSVNDIRWWGAVGDGLMSDISDTSVVTAKDESLLSDSGTDNYEAFTSCISRVKGREGIEVSLAGLTYGVSSQVQIPEYTDRITFRDGTLFCLSGFTGDSIVKVGEDSTSNSDGQYPLYNKFINIFFNARWRANCFTNSGASLTILEHCRTDYFTSYGLGALTRGNINAYGHGGQEIPLGLAESLEYADREGYAYYFETGDNKLINCVGSCSKSPIYYKDGYNYQIDACHFWVGGYSGDIVDPYSIICEADGGTWTNIYVDEGIVQVTDAFNNRFVGINGANGTYGNKSPIFVLETSSENTTAPALVIDGVSTDRFTNNDYIEFTSSGDGYWSDYPEFNICSISSPNSGRRTNDTAYDYSGRLKVSADFIYSDLGQSDESASTFNGLTNSGSAPFLQYNVLSRPSSSVTSQSEDLRGVEELKTRISPSGDITTQPSTANVLYTLHASASNGTDLGASAANNLRWRSTDFGGAYLQFRAHNDWTASDMQSRAYLRVSMGDGTYGGLDIIPSAISPTYDNTYDLGQSSVRWSNIYAANSTISTSDARLKTDLVELTDDEVSAAVAISKAMGYTWQWLEGGDRTHTGPTVQLIMGIMEENNLTPFDYSFICYDEWDEQTEKVEVTPAVLDEDGNVVTEAVYEEQVVLEAGDRYSFRENELVKFCNAGLSARIDSQQETIDSILTRLDALES